MLEIAGIEVEIANQLDTASLTPGIRVNSLHDFA